eukprot:jgi/Psemu1/50650/gm1.50650_g
MVITSLIWKKVTEIQIVVVRMMILLTFQMTTTTFPLSIICKEHIGGNHTLLRETSHIDREDGQSQGEHDWEEIEQDREDITKHVRTITSTLVNIATLFADQRAPNTNNNEANTNTAEAEGNLKALGRLHPLHVTRDGVYDRDGFDFDGWTLTWIK